MLSLLAKTGRPSWPCNMPAHRYGTGARESKLPNTTLQPPIRACGQFKFAVISSRGLRLNVEPLGALREEWFKTLAAFFRETCNCDSEIIEMLFRQPPDFRVRYSFRPPEQGGRHSGPPKQGYRCDFLYSDQVPGKDPVYYIWPEFEDENGNVIAQGAPVLPNGTARMFIVQDKLRGFHSGRIRPGVQGYLLEGNRPVADVEVVQVFARSDGA